MTTPSDDEWNDHESGGDDDAWGESWVPNFARATEEYAGQWSERRRSESRISVPEQNHLPHERVWQQWRRIAMWGRSETVDDFGRDPVSTARWERIMEVLYRHWFRIAVRGIQHIPDHGGAILVANHAGALPYDVTMLMHAVRREHPRRRDVRPLVEDTVMQLPFLGPLLSRIGAVRACPENAERLVKQGELIAVFPEGEKGATKLWRDRHQLQRFGRGGFVRLAARTGCPILPVAIVGAEEAAPLLGKVTKYVGGVGLPWLPITPTFPLLGPAGLLPLPSRWRIEIGQPLRPDVKPTDQAAVQRAADDVRASLQAMVTSLVDQRGRAYL